jgi:hypothetical protein
MKIQKLKIGESFVFAGTFQEAQEKIMSALKQKGWKVSSPDLKIQWALPPGKDASKVWFKSQALWKGQSRPINSMHLDVKALSEKSADEIEKELLKELV